MGVIKGHKDLQKAMMSMLDKSVTHSADKASEAVRDSIQRSVYDAHTPLIYERTGDLKESYQLLDSKTTSDGTKAKIGFDYSKINPVRLGYKHWSAVDDTPYVKDLPWAIQSGNVGSHFGMGPWTEKRDFWAVGEYDAHNVFSKTLLDGLKRQGVNVK